MRKSIGKILFDACNYVLLAVLGALTLYPFLYTLTLSLSSPAEAMNPGFKLIPLQPSIESYVIIFKQSLVYTSYSNTLFRTTVATILGVFITATVAYPLSRPTFPFRKSIIFLFVFSLLFNGGIVPKYLLIKQLGLINNLWSLILPGLITAFVTIVMVNFFKSIHEELLESARMDGANEFVVLLRIVLPLSVSVLAVAALWRAVAHWNAWFDALLYINDSKKQVLQMYLRRMVLT